jgi:hypothetical protein
LKALEQATNGLGAILSVEVVDAEVAVLGAIAEHVVHGCEPRGRGGKDCFLGAAAGLYAQGTAPASSWS